MSDNAQISTSIVFDKLLEEHIIQLGEQVDSGIANKLYGQVLLLAVEDPESDISLYTNSPDGFVTANMAIRDTMQFVPCDVITYGMGLAASMGQFLLVAGAKGGRYALLHTCIMMHQPSVGIDGIASDITIQAEQFTTTRRGMACLVAQHTDQPVKRIEEDSGRDRWFTAVEAKEYGLIDHVVTALRDTARWKRTVAKNQRRNNQHGDKQYADAAVALRASFFRGALQPWC